MCCTSASGVPGEGVGGGVGSEYYAHLWTLVSSLKDVNGLSGQVVVHTVLDWPYNVFLFLESFSRWGRDRDFEDFERGMRQVRLPVFSGWHNVEISTVPPC